MSKKIALEFINELFRGSDIFYTEEDLSEKEKYINIPCYLHSERAKELLEKLPVAGYLKYLTGFGINYSDLKYRNEARMLEIALEGGNDYLEILKEKAEAVDYILKTAFEPLQDYGAKIFFKDGKIIGEIEGKEYIIAPRIHKRNKELTGLNFSEFMKIATDWAGMDFINSALYQISPGWNVGPVETISFKKEKILGINKEFLFEFLVRNKGNELVKKYLNSLDSKILEKFKVSKQEVKIVKPLIREIEEAIAENKRENAWLLAYVYLTASSYIRANKDILQLSKKLLTGKILHEVTKVLEKKGKMLSKWDRNALIEGFPHGIKEIIFPYINREYSGYTLYSSFPIPSIPLQKENKKKSPVIV